MAAIAEARPLPHDARQPLVSRRWLLTAGTTAVLGAAAGLLYIPPREETPVNNQVNTLLFPGSVESRVNAPLIVYPSLLNGNDTPSPKGPTALLSEAVSKIPLLHELTQNVVVRYYEEIAANTFLLRDALQYTAEKTRAFFQELSEKPTDNFNPNLEAIHFSLFPLTILGTAPWFKSGQLTLFGFPQRAFTDLMNKAAIELYSQPGKMRHQIVSAFYAFMYAYSNYYGLNLHTSLPGIIRWPIITNRLLGKYPTQLDEAVDFAVAVGRLYEYSNLGDLRNWPALNAPDNLREGPFAQDADEDDRANRFGAKQGVRLFADAVSGRSLAEILERYNHAVGIAA